MKALVFAAGLGTRLRPVTDTMPKALVPVGGVPMLERVVRKIAAAGFGPVVVNAHYLADQIVRFVGVTDLGVRVDVSVEDGPEPLETGGGIRHAAPLLGSGRFLVHNADILSDIDLRWLASKDDPESLATLCLVDRPADRMLLFDGGMRLVGWMNVRTGEVKSPYPGLDPASCRKFSFCGIHIVSDAVFPLMETWPEKFGIIDFYLSVCADHIIRGVVADNPEVVDIGSPESLAEAERRVETFVK